MTPSAKAGAPTPEPDDLATRAEAMTINRSPDVPALDPQTAIELRAGLSRSIAAGAHDDALKALINRAAREARQKDVRAEHLVMALKDLWYALPQVSAVPGNAPQTRLLQELVTRCIQDYYTG